VITIDLSGKRAVVIGGATGIGRAAAIHLANAGAEVLTLSRRSTVSELDCPPEIADRIRHQTLDITDGEAVRNTFARIKARGSLHISVHSAGILKAAKGLDTDDAMWRAHMATNVDGTFYTVREALRQMVESGGGKIIIIGSVSGQVGNPGFAAYCASKALLINLTRQLAVDYARMGVNINSIMPGFTLTEMTEIYDEETHKQIAELIPAKAWATAEQIADAVLFLASPLSDYIHGANVPVDGGYLAGLPE
jgi:Dehydrogenases with different specificities (related to short-chain alcohol dehydrogenases)